jgi:hypothetical protein
MDISEKRRAASRANGSKSRGPVTISGKANSSRNALRNQQLSSALLLNGESSDLLRELIAGLHREFQPQTEIERMLLDTMAASRWRQMRSWSMETATLAWEIRKQSADSPQIVAEDPATRAALAYRNIADASRALDQITRAEARYDRQYNRALQLLLSLRPASSATSEVSPSDLAA